MVNDVVAFFGGKKDGTANVGTGLEDIKKGDIFVMNYETQAIVAAGETAQDHPVICVVGCVKDGEPIPSGPIYAKTAEQYSKSDFVEAVAQKDYVGVPPVGDPKVHNFHIVLFTELRLQPNRQVRLDFNIYSEGGEDLRDKLRDAINEAGNDNNPRLKAFKYVTATNGNDNTHLNIIAEVLEKDNPVDQFSQISFTCHGDDAFGITTNGDTPDSDAYVRGSGSGWETRDKEILHMGQWGYTDRRDTMRKEYPFVTQVDNSYNILSLSWQAPVRGDMQQQFQGPATVTIAFGAADVPTVTQYDAINAILQPWAESTYAKVTLPPAP